MKNDSNCCVITGYGACVPAGGDSQSYWDAICNNKQFFTKKRLFGSEFPAQVVAVIDNSSVKHGLSKRQIKKLDRFTILAIAATRQALTMSNLPNDSQSLSHYGIVLGNNTGGWGFVEPQMGPLYAEGMDTISPYVATAWFPTAPQGEISILFGFGGYSKTFSAENISAGFAFEHAINLLQEGVLNMCLAGGTEAPVTQLVYNACMEAGLLSENGKYLPYTKQAHGTVLAEAAALFVLESREMAEKRGAEVHASIHGIGKGSTLEISMNECLISSKKIAKEIDYIILNASGFFDPDMNEYFAIAQVFNDNPEILMSAPKSKYGNILGANMAVDLLTACLALEKQMIPPSYSSNIPILQPTVGKHVVGKPKAARIRHVMINGRDNYGQCISLLVSKEYY